VVAAGGEPARFRLLESLRAYGAGRLADAGEAEAVTARHTAWCLGLAGTGGQGSDEAWLERVRADYDNLRAALDRALAAPDPDTAVRLAGALAGYWAADHHDEGRRRIEAALALAPGRRPPPSWPGRCSRWPCGTSCCGRARPPWTRPDAAWSCSSSSGTGGRRPCPR
jgi:predicted ATPase